ncbi:MAG: spore germination protein [Pseudomonadota bacterium]
MKLSNSLQENIEALKSTFKEDQSLSIREFSVGGINNVECAAVFLAGMVDMGRINSEIISPLLNIKAEVINSDILITSILKNAISAPQVETTGDYETVVSFLLDGNTLVFIDEHEKALYINTLKLNRRENNEPDTEKVVRGPREGFNESLFNNISLIRARIKSESFKLHFRVIGRITKTKICVCYLQDVASLEIVEEVERRLDRIDIDGILDSGYIQELVADEGYSPFLTVGYTERPDVVAGKILNGKIAIVCDGSPFVLTLPFVFSEYFHINENYYSNFYYSTFNRILSFLGFFITTSLPAIYCALVTFHQELLPTPLILSISAARQGIPLPTIAEMILILFVFEVLREASVRIPAVIGPTISIVGALIIGQAAVEAKLISAPIIIIAAASGITSFLVPKMEQGIVMSRLAFLLASAFMGLYGYIFCVVALFIHLCSIRSFGIPYMLYISSINVQDQKNTLIRAPWWLMKRRPRIQADKNPDRQRS